jgi:protocatechuate 3,4-dioxygenase beta subunit
VRFDVADERFARLSYENDISVGMQSQITAPPIRLQEASSIRGKLTYEQTGKPAAKVQVGVQATNRSRGSGWGSAFTDDNGEYHVKQLPKGEYNVMLYELPENDNDWTAAAIEAVNLGPAQHLENQNLTLTKGSIITGELILKDTGEGVAEAYVGAHTPARPQSGGAIQGAPTAKDGSFSLRVPPGKQYLYLAQMPPEGYLRPTPWEGEVKPGETRTVDIELARDPAPPVAGRVVDAQNQPVADAIVIAHRRDEAFFQDRGIKTTKDGRFGFRAVPKNSVIEAKKGDLKSERIVTQGEEDNLLLVIVKEPVASLLVSVLDQQGKAIKGAEVHLITDPQPGVATDKLMGLTDEQGRLAIPNLPVDGIYRITVEAAGFRWNAEDVRPHLQADKERVVKVILKPK